MQFFFLILVVKYLENLILNFQIIKKVLVGNHFYNYLEK